MSSSINNVQKTNKLKLVDSKVKLDISEFKTLLNDILIQKKKILFL